MCRAIINTKKINYFYPLNLDELETCLNDNQFNQLFEQECNQYLKIDEKVFLYLTNRCSLLINAYKSTDTDGNKLNDVSPLVWRLTAD